jgi:hypothetical protein
LWGRSVGSAAVRDGFPTSGSEYSLAASDSFEAANADIRW